MGKGVDFRIEKFLMPLKRNEKRLAGKSNRNISKKEYGAFCRRNMSKIFFWCSNGAFHNIALNNCRKSVRDGADVK